MQHRYSRVCWTCWRWHRNIRNPAKHMQKVYGDSIPIYYQHSD